MGFLGRVEKRFKGFGEKRLESRIDKLVKDTERIDGQFRSELKRLGIDVNMFTSKNYYEILGIKYTNDQELIHNSYLRMIKKYHPDVSRESDAKEKSGEINEAYGVLKEKSKKLDYDTTFSKGASKLTQEATYTVIRLSISKQTLSDNSFGILFTISFAPLRFMSLCLLLLRKSYHNQASLTSL